MKPRKCRAPCNNTKLELYADDKAYEERLWLCCKCGSMYLDAYGPKSPSYVPPRKKKGRRS